MLMKVLSRSGRRILKVVKKFSTISRSEKKCQPKLIPQSSSAIVPWSSTIATNKAPSLSWSLASLDDTKSIDTNLTFVSDAANDDERCCCCCCDEHEEENQRNENKENEMFL